jgi:glutathione S-transferase
MAAGSAATTAAIAFGSRPRIKTTGSTSNNGHRRARLDFLAGRLRGDYLFGSEFSVADAYLYVMLRWGRMKGLDLPEPLSAFAERMNTRPAVRLALQHEGLA